MKLQLRFICKLKNSIIMKYFSQKNLWLPFQYFRFQRRFYREPSAYVSWMKCNWIGVCIVHNLCNIALVWRMRRLWCILINSIKIHCGINSQVGKNNKIGIAVTRKRRMKKTPSTNANRYTKYFMTSFNWI